MILLTIFTAKGVFIRNRRIVSVGADVNFIMPVGNFVGEVLLPG